MFWTPNHFQSVTEGRSTHSLVIDVNCRWSIQNALFHLMLDGQTRHLLILLAIAGEVALWKHFKVHMPLIAFTM